MRRRAVRDRIVPTKTSPQRQRSPIDLDTQRGSGERHARRPQGRTKGRQRDYSRGREPSFFHSDRASPTTITATSARFMTNPGGLPILGMGRIKKIPFLIRCSSKSNTKMKGTKARYRTNTTRPIRFSISWESPQAAKRATNACSPAAVNVSKGIPSAEMAAERPLRIVPKAMPPFMSTTRPRSHSASLWPRYVLSTDLGISFPSTEVSFDYAELLHLRPNDE
jgi:hypothetical protein